MSLSGLITYFLWLLGVSWQFLVIFVAFFGVILSHDLFFMLRTLKKERLLAWIQTQKKNLNGLEPLEAILIAAGTSAFAMLFVWHTFVQPVVWDSLVLYDFRAERISDGWQVEHFFEQFPFSERFAAYDFSHPFLSSIWQALAYSTTALVSSFIYVGLLLSVLSVAWKVLPTRKSWIAFFTLFMTSSLLFTVWTQNYSIEPYTLYWLLIVLLSLAPAEKNQNSSLVLLFLITSMQLRISEPYWLVFLLWISWPILRSQERFDQKLLHLCFWWLPVLAVFAQWWQLQAEAASFVHLAQDITLSSYDPSRYRKMGEIIASAQFWYRWAETLLLKNTLLPFFLLATFFIFPQNSKSFLRKSFWLLLLFTGMLSAALLLEMVADWPEWEGKARLLQRAGIPIVAVASVIIAQRTGTYQLQSRHSSNQRTKLGE